MNLYIWFMKYLLIGIMSMFLWSATAQSFPKEWIGNYHGEMLIGFENRSGDTLEVDFGLQEIVKDSSWTYKMTYHSQKFGEIVKDYIIRKTGDSESGYVLDEQDGILIEMTLMDNCFYSSFEVLESIYTTTLYKRGGDLFFDLIVVSANPTKETVSKDDEDGNSFQVKSYKPTLHQSVYLKRY